MEFAHRHILILGLGATGLSAARWLAHCGARVSVADTRARPPQADALARVSAHARLVSGPFSNELLADVDGVVISPGVPKDQAIVREAVSRHLPVVGDVELFAQALPAGQKVLAITGSNGKSTVTTLAGELCQAAGLRTVVAGNIGLPVLDALCEIEGSGIWPDVFVLELSSFQLETTSSLHAAAATVLNLSEDHLDRYAGMADYAAAKARIFAGNGVQVLNRDDAATMAMIQAGRRIFTFGADAPGNEMQWGLIAAPTKWLARGRQRILPASELGILGRHNALNALAALALVAALGVDAERVLPALKSFRGLAHRVERVAEKRGVLYIDDSKGTNVGATVAALEGLGRPAVLIAGGEGKSQDFSPLLPVVAAHCRAVLTIGRDAPTIERALAGSGVKIEHCSSLPAAVTRAAALAQPGDAVLLSPACASFDMFRDYAHRSEVFVSAVNSLSEGGTGA